MESRRSDFKSNAHADAVAAGKLIAAGQKELKALQALLNDEHIKRFPGPPVCFGSISCPAAPRVSEEVDRMTMFDVLADD